MTIPTLYPHSPKPTQEQLLKRGRIAVLEQMKIFKQIFTVTSKPQAPRTRGEVAAQEQGEYSYSICQTERFSRGGQKREEK